MTRTDLLDWLRSFDVVLLSTSGGKDSQAMMDLVTKLAREAGVYDRLVAVHCDLGRAEWQGTTDLVREQCAAYDVPLRIVARPQGDLLQQIEDRGMFPSSTTRYCTSDQKRGQVQKVYTALQRERGVKGEQFRILDCMGLRAEESSARAKKVTVELNKRGSTKTRTVYHWLPIHDWLVEDVWSCIRASGVRHHQAYDLGMPRLSCVFCIMAPRNAVMLAAKHNRSLLDEYIELEGRIDHDFQAKWSLAGVRDDLDAGVEPTRVQDWTM